ncbi:MAG: hypothetical protein ACFE9Z_06420 [Promethearchaeota archaeon]
MLKTDLNDFAVGYFTLGLRINKHINGYVEHYYGPPEIKRKIDLEEKLSPKVLLDNFNNLKRKLDKQNFESNRLNFFNKTFTAIETILKKLSGEKIPYLEQVEKLFDFTPKLYDEDVFHYLSSKAEKAYKGEGSLPQRMKNYIKKRKIPVELLKTLYIKSLNIAREKTKVKFPNLLPKEEFVDVKLVKDVHWSMYNWYLGEFKSRIDINIDINQYWTNLLFFACHEGYPGHHTDRCAKNVLLYHNKGYFENCISLIYTPEFVIYEGMGELAQDVIFNIEEIAEISLRNLSFQTYEYDTLDSLIQQYEIKKGFRGFNQNLAYFKHIKGWKDEKLIKYSEQFKYLSKQNIIVTLNFISDDVWAPYVLAYQGERIIREKFGDPPNLKFFRKLISEKVLPSDLV